MGSRMRGGMTPGSRSSRIGRIGRKRRIGRIGRERGIRRRCVRLATAALVVVAMLVVMAVVVAIAAAIAVVMVVPPHVSLLMKPGLRERPAGTGGTNRPKIGESGAATLRLEIGICGRTAGASAHDRAHLGMLIDDAIA
jgi:hypothetical protein